MLRQFFCLLLLITGLVLAVPANGQDSLDPVVEDQLEAHQDSLLSLEQNRRMVELLELEQEIQRSRTAYSLIVGVVIVLAVVAVGVILWFVVFKRKNSD